MRVPRAGLLLLGLFAFVPHVAQAVDRFPRPDFESGYTQPFTTSPMARTWGLEALDVVVLAVALGLAAWFALRARSRRGLFWLAVFSLLYFGFWRRGCVCSVGSFQGVALALADPAYVLSWSTALFFLLPLVFALYFGRVFCASVCPLGAVQEMLTLRPVSVPSAVDRALRIVPFLYLGWGVLLAVMGAGFPVCEQDPYVAFFRFGGKWHLWVFGGVLLLVGIFVARPYCRFICPYGAMLSVVSRFSRHHLSITPEDCVQCRLCETACPYGAIRRPTPLQAHWPETRTQARIRLARLLVLWPLLIFAGVGVGLRLQKPLAAMHPVTALAERVVAEDLGLVKGTTLNSETFRGLGRSREALVEEARAVRRRLRVGGGIFGGYAGLVAGWFLVGLSLRRPRKDYVADRANCVSCGRCFAACPVGKGPAPLASDTQAGNISPPAAPSARAGTASGVA